MRVVAADSGAAVLNDRFEPLLVVAVAAVVVEPPYREVGFCLAEPIFITVENGPLLVIHELQLCQSLLKEVRADVVHLDMSLGGLSLEELSPIRLSKMRLSDRAREQILRILPTIRKIATDIRRVYGIEVLAIGEDSVPVRIAELVSGAYAILYSAEKVVKEGNGLRLGLPTKCSSRFLEDGVVLRSLAPAEHDIKGYAKDEKGVLGKVQISEMPNPCARGFRVLEICPL
ncbi:MAG: hypothetical protein AOA65_0902 [Candidatus Bathyarchaeota archaeon BA1]|nr:MAG: hypothetical protein AOA65_0902 [Candidatus Bathyarchaeota archaeon BA1]